MAAAIWAGVRVSSLKSTSRSSRFDRMGLVQTSSSLQFGAVAWMTSHTLCGVAWATQAVMKYSPLPSENSAPNDFQVSASRPIS